MHPANRSAPKQTGFTLLEMVLAVVILAALTKVAMMKLVTPGTLTVRAQAQAAADAVRRAQTLAMVRGQRTSVTVSAGTNGSVTIACVASAPCTTDSTQSVSQGVVMGSMNTIYFNSLGQPVSSTGVPLANDATVTVSYSPGSSFTVTVAALTGRVSVSP
jgi:prepilin-type N-terminal cleavage/methylation domain-containing protein